MVGVNVLAMPEQLYKNHEIEILLTRYKEHAEHLRHLDLFDIKVVTGFIAIQLLLGSWFVGHPVPGNFKVALIVIDFAFWIACARTLWSSRNRRKEIVDTILNINEALGLKIIGAYLPGKMINPDVQRYQFYWYEIGCLMALTGAGVVIVFS